MGTLNERKTRYGILKNMVRRGREGTSWGRRGFSGGRFPAEDREAPGEIEAYVEGHTAGRGIEKWRHYLPIYERHFEKFKGTDVAVLEIGVYSGGSLELWRDYFGPDARIYGVDVRDACKSYERDGTRIFIGDQADRSFWESVKADVPELDVVIDDGGHRTPEQIASLESLLPHLRPGGVYVIEDVCGEYNAFHDYSFGLSRLLHTYPTGPRARPGFEASDFQKSIEGIHLYPFMTVIEKRAERLSSPKMGDEWQPASFWSERPTGWVPAQ